MHPAKRGLAVAALLLTGSALLSACGSNSSSSDAKEITIGAPLPLTGPAADLGEHSKNGLDLYQDTINKAGGVTVDGKKMKVKIIYCDTQYQAAKAISCGRKLASEDHVTGMVPVTTVSTLPLA